MDYVQFATAITLFVVSFPITVGLKPRIPKFVKFVFARIPLRLQSGPIVAIELVVLIVLFLLVLSSAFFLMYKFYAFLFTYFGFPLRSAKQHYILTEREQGSAAFWLILIIVVVQLTLGVLVRYLRKRAAAKRNERKKHKDRISRKARIDKNHQS